MKKQIGISRVVHLPVINTLVINYTCHHSDIMNCEQDIIHSYTKLLPTYLQNIQVKIKTFNYNIQLIIFGLTLVSSQIKTTVTFLPYLYNLYTPDQ